MNFLQSYQSNVKLNKSEDIHIFPNILIPNIYEYHFSDSNYKESSAHFLQILAGGNIKLQFPISFSFFSLDCYLLLYTKQGQGKIIYSDSEFPLKKDTFFFCDCHHPFSMESISFPWIFKIFFISKNGFDLFTPLTQKEHPALFQIPEVSPIRQHMNRILSSNTNLSLRERLQIHESLTIILSNLCYSFICEESSKTSTSNIPSYLSEMKDYFDHHYHENFSLDEYEKLFNISKYRLCREFSNIYGLPPLKYLIKKRITISKTMLLETNWTIHEISTKVGYDNVTHFINLFKKDTGLTPALFRQRAREGDITPLY